MSQKRSKKKRDKALNLSNYALAPKKDNKGTGEIVTIPDAARLFMQHHGRGMMLHLGEGSACIWVLATSKAIEPAQKILIEAYNPENEVVLSAPLIEECPEWLLGTSIYKFEDPAIAFKRLRVPHLGVFAFTDLVCK